MRHNINEFRDGRWDGLVRARNHLIEAVVFTGLAMYALVAITILMNVSRDALLAATVFFLVGSLVGFFKRLRDESAADTHSEDDYGLSRARLVHTPLFSGLAAVGGVVSFAFVPALLSNDVLAPKTLASNASSMVATRTPLPTATTATLTVSASATRTVTSVATATNTRVTGVSGASFANYYQQNAPTTTPIVTFTVVPTFTATSPSNSTAPSTPVATATTPIPTAVSTPSATATATEEQSISSPEASKDLPMLEDIFNLERNRVGLILAAIFGLAPTLLVSTLQKQVEQYKRDLKNTEAPESNRRNDNDDSWSGGR